MSYACFKELVTAVRYYDGASFGTKGGGGLKEAIGSTAMTTNNESDIKHQKVTISKLNCFCQLKTFNLIVFYPIQLLWGRIIFLYQQHDHFTTPGDPLQARLHKMELIEKLNDGGKVKF